MSTMTIRNTGDVERSRNIVRRLIMGQKWSPTICARAIATLTTLAELMLESPEGGELDVSVAPHYANRGVEFQCDVALSGIQEGELDEARDQLEQVVSELHMQQQTNCVRIVARVWLS